MKLVVLIFLLAFAYVQAEEGCLVSNQAAIVPSSLTTVVFDDNRAAEYYDECAEDLYFVEEFIPGGGVALKSTQHGTYLEPYVDVDGSIKIRLSSDSFFWQKELVSGKHAFYTEDVATFGEQGKYLSACWDWLTLEPEALNCESFEFQQIPEKYAEEGCLVSNQAAIVPSSLTTVVFDDNRAAELYGDCAEDLYFVEEIIPGQSGVALKSTQHGTYLKPYVDVDGSIKIRLSSNSFLWQKELVSGKHAFYTEDVATFGKQGKYLSACWDWLTLAPEALNCESFEFQLQPKK